MASMTNHTERRFSMLREQRNGDASPRTTDGILMGKKVPGPMSPSEDEGPTPPPKDQVHQPLTTPIDAESYFNSLRSSRANSICSLSRMSFSSQLSRLTALHLPDAMSLSTSISAIPAASAAANTLNIAAEQIRRWLQKASEVLDGLDAEDDVEWAAAGGREGLGEVDAAIGRFEGLIAPYVTAIETLQEREDITKVPPLEQKNLVSQVEQILKEWENVRKMLRGVKSQVELAMEWEELWNVVLGDIGLEMENLGRLIFEMEEARHRAMKADRSNDSGANIDVQELETIVEEAPTANGSSSNNRFSLPSAFSAMSPTSPAFSTPQEDSRLLGLFARMQPLRASLDFLPMTLSSFRTRAVKTLPSACQELDDRRKDLEKKWKSLESDAESLRKELGEDRWVLVFRNAGRQAQKLCESVERSVSKLQESIDAGNQHNNPPVLAKKIESYEAKKIHYGPAIERVLAIIEKGVKDRLTVNGEILRLQQETRSRWRAIEAEMKDMDLALDDLSMNKNQQLRDSISTIMSADKSVAGSIDTPGSSPASSPIFGSSVVSKSDPSPGINGLSRRNSVISNGTSRPNGSRRYASMPHAIATSNQLPRKTPVSRSMSSDSRNASPSPYAPSSATSGSTARPGRPGLAPSDNKPRWNSSPKVNYLEYSPIPRPSPLPAPTPNRKSSMTFRSPLSASSSISQNMTLRSPLGRSSTSSPAPPQSPAFPPHHRLSSGAQSSLGVRQTSYSSARPINSSPRSASKSQTNTPNQPPSSSSRRQSMLIHSEDVAEESSPSVRPRPPRPVTAMAGRRNSMLPLPKSVIESGRESSLGSRIPSSGRDTSLGIRQTNGGVRATSGRESSMGGEKRWR